MTEWITRVVEGESRGAEKVEDHDGYEVTNFSFGQNPEILPGRIWQILGVKTTKICQIRPGKFGQNSS